MKQKQNVITSYMSVIRNPLSYKARQRVQLIHMQGRLEESVIIQNTIIHNGFSAVIRLSCVGKDICLFFIKPVSSSQETTSSPL